MSLPPSYVTGTVIFNAMLCLGDLDGDGILEASDVQGQITFTPDEPIYIAATVPRLLVGNQGVTYDVVDGQLRDAIGAPGVSLYVGRWRAGFSLAGVKVPGVTFYVTEAHTEVDPLDLASRVALPQASFATASDDQDLSDTFITDTEDGGLLINGLESAKVAAWRWVKDTFLTKIAGDSYYAPKSHASEHAGGGSDVITPGMIGASRADHTHVDGGGSGGGTEGPAGLSAYEIAVANGFVGTESQWLSSLTGPRGEKGNTGEQGPVTTMLNTPNAQRPVTHHPVIWFWGETQPLNMAVDDIWVTSDPPGPPPVQQPAALVADYAFDEGSGTTAASTTASANITGISTWTPRGFGNALAFTGTPATLPATNVSGTNGQTLMFRIRCNYMAWGSDPTLISSAGTEGGAIGLNWLYNGGKLMYFSKGAYLLLEEAPLQEGTWHVFTMTASPPDIDNSYVITNRFFLDGDFVYEYVGGNLIPDTTGTWTLGDDGILDIDDLRLWSTVLDSNELYTEMFR